MKPRRPNVTPYMVIIILLMVAGSAPAAFNFFVDPFAMNQRFGLGLDRKTVSEKAHYALWKMIEFPRQTAEHFVLGDSRARALQDRYWKELSVDGVYNFAYGGATIPEIYDTFVHLQRNVPIKTLIVSLPLRSFYDGHRGGLNRVPEAVHMARNPLSYYTSWFVAGVGWRLIEEQHGETLDSLRGLLPWSVAGAKAQTLFNDPSLENLLDPDLCAGCILPPERRPRTKHSASDLITFGPWRGFWHTERPDRDLTGKFERQVRKSARNDWGSFTFSDSLFGLVEEIARWCHQSGVKLVFVIPPTIADMQWRAVDYGIVLRSMEFRRKLARLAPVVDLDFDNELTRDLSYFTDAYHFDSRLARKMVFELSKVADLDGADEPSERGRDVPLGCPIGIRSQQPAWSDQSVHVYQGRNCRVWRASHDQK